MLAVFQYPVVAVDGEMLVVNPFNGRSHGQLQVLLAMGSRQQIVSLQNTKYGLTPGYHVPERPAHYLER